jgi:hypothetical protein
MHILCCRETNVVMNPWSGTFWGGDTSNGLYDSDVLSLAIIMNAKKSFLHSHWGWVGTD